MITTQNTMTVTENGAAVKICNHRGWRGLNAKPVIVASDNQHVHEWIYRYLEPYSDQGYAFYQAGSDDEFQTLVRTEKSVMAFIEDCFFGEKAIGAIERIRKEYPKLSLSAILDSVYDYDLLPDKDPYLTRREIEVVRCFAEEKTKTETASCLMLSKRTVDNHLSSVYRKFGVRNKVGVLKLAVSKGILPVSELMTYTVQS